MLSDPQFHKKLNYRTKLFLILVGTIIPLFGIVSFTFYREFTAGIDNRIFEQLNSVRSLKYRQIKQYVDKANLSDTLQDLTAISESKILAIQNGDTTQFLSLSPIFDILLHREGLGDSGESYLVDSTKKLVSPSRFISRSEQDKIIANTIPVDLALRKTKGQGIHKDYRGIWVFSSYSNIDILGKRMALLSEIDFEEGRKPIIALRNKMIGISFFVIILIVVLAYIISNAIAKPVRLMGKYLTEVTENNHSIPISIPESGDDIADMFRNLKDLVDAKEDAIKFAESLNYNDLEYAHTENRSNLGLALLNMKNKLLEEKQQKDEIRRDSIKKIKEAEYKERLRLARDLHDGVGPLLTYLKLQIEAFDSLTTQEKTTIKNTILQIISEVKMVSKNLMPTVLDDFGLIAALENQVNEFNRNDQIKVTLNAHSELDEMKLSNEIKNAVYRIAQELIHNAIKHSGASQIICSVSIFEDYVSLTVSDNGTGFKNDRDNNGMGLMNIKDRIETLNGMFVSERNEGWTVLEIEIPIK